MIFIYKLYGQSATSDLISIASSGDALFVTYVLNDLCFEKSVALLLGCKCIVGLTHQACVGIHCIGADCDCVPVD